MTMWLAVPAALVLPACGYFVWRWIGPAGCRSPRSSLGFALPVGVVLLGIESLVWAHLAPERHLGLPGALVPLALVLVVAWWSARRRDAEAPPAVSRPEAELGVLGWIGLALILSEMALSIASLAAAPRLTDWDGWAIWGFKAKAFYVDGGVGRYLAHGHEYAFSWPARPCLSALFETFLYRCVGRIEEGVVGVGHLGFFASLLLVFHSSLRRRLSAGGAMLGTGILATVPNLTYQAAAGVANVVFAVYLFAALEALDVWASDPGVTRLGGPALLLAGACLSRDEGIVLAVVVLTGALLVAPPFAGRSWSVRLRAGAALVVACGVAYALWESLVVRYGASDALLARWTSVPDAWVRLAGRGRALPPLLHAIVAELAVPGEQTRSSPLEEVLGLSLFWPLFALACLRAPRLLREDPMALRGALIAVTGIFLYALALAVYPDGDVSDIIDHWTFALDRHAIAVLPMAARTLAGVLGPPLDPRSARRR